MSSEIFAFRCKAGLFKVGMFNQYVHGDFWTDEDGRLPPATLEAQTWLFYWSVPGEKWVPLVLWTDFPEYPARDGRFVGTADDYLLPVEMAMLDAISARHGGYIHEPKETV